MNQNQKNILAILLLLWLLIVITAYFVVQKPWPSSGALRALQALVDVVLAAALLALAGGLGRKLLGRFPKAHPHEEMAIHAGIGLGILSLVILALGVAGFIGTITIWLLLLAGLVWLRRSTYKWAANLFRGTAIERPSGVVAKVALAVMAILLFTSLIEALAPPLKWDSLVYHLALPQNYLQNGKVGFVSGNLFVGFPQLAEMLYAGAMALRAGTTAAVLGWFVGLIAILGLAGLASRLFGKLGGWLAPVVVLSGASLWQGLAWAYVDHWVLLYGVLLLICLEHYSQDSNKHWLWLAGAAIGFAASAKYTGGFLGLAAVVWLLSLDLPALVQKGKAQPEFGDGKIAPRSINLKEIFGNIAIVTLVALALFSPWLLKNWLTSGNPLYPFLWPGREIDSLRQTFHAQGDSTLNPLSVPLLPWLATILGVEGGAGFNSSIGPLYLALIPGIAFGFGSFDARVSRFLRRLGLIAVLGWALWGVGGLIADPLSRSRHYYGFLPALALLAVAGYLNIAALKVRGIRIGWVITQLVLFSILLTGIAAIFHLGHRNPLPVVLGQEEGQDYLAEQLGWYGPTMAYMDELAPDANIEMLWEARSYYCPRTCQPDVILDKWWYWQRIMGNNQSIADELQNQGVTHVLIYDFGAEFERRTRDLQQPADWRALEEFRYEQLELLEKFGDGYSLYTWREK